MVELHSGEGSSGIMVETKHLNFSFFCRVSRVKSKMYQGGSYKFFELLWREGRVAWQLDMSAPRDEQRLFPQQQQSVCRVQPPPCIKASQNRNRLNTSQSALRPAILLYLNSQTPSASF